MEYAKLQTNHRFEGVNSVFDWVTSPRFGLIKCIRSARVILRGNEVFVNYGYDVKGLVPGWYRKLHRAVYGKDGKMKNQSF